MSVLSDSFRAYYQKLLEGQDTIMPEDKKSFESILNMVLSWVKRANDLAQVKPEKRTLKGKRGCHISQTVLENDSDFEEKALKLTLRDTINDGIKYSFMETEFGDGNHQDSFVKVIEAFEGEERTYYEVNPDYGPHWVESKELGYDEVYDFDKETGIPIKTQKRNPAKDAKYQYVRDNKNGTVETTDRPIVDEKGNIIGSFHKTEHTNSPYSRIEDRFKKNTTIERCCKDKDGNDMMFKSEIYDDGKGIIRRQDYVNGKKVATIIVNEELGVGSMSHFKDDQKTCYVPYIYDVVEKKWLNRDPKYYENGAEIDYEEYEGDAISYPDEFSKEAIFSQSAFVEYEAVPQELRNVLQSASLQKPRTIGAYGLLNNEAIDELEKGSKLKPHHDNGISQ